MGTPLRVLIVEDSENDALLLLRELERGGYEVTSERVDTPEAMTAALEAGEWDIIISDYRMPRFSGFDALKLLQGSELDLPFILVSGTIGEDVAVAAMKAGAHDYVMKGNLPRLVPAVGRELREAEVRRGRGRAEKDRKHKSRDLKYIAKTALEFAAFAPEGDIYEHIARRLKEIVGDAIVFVSSFNEASGMIQCRAVDGLGKFSHSVLKLIGKDPVGMLFPISEEAYRELRRGKFAKVPGGLHTLALGQIPEKACKAIEKLLGVGGIYAIGIAREGRLFGNASIVTRTTGEPKDTSLIETFINQASVALQRKLAQDALLNAAEEWRTTFDTIGDAICVLDREGRVARCNRAMANLLGKPFAEIIGRPCYELIHNALTFVEGCPFVDMKRTRRREGATLEAGGRWFEVAVDPLPDDGGNIAGAVHIMTDITERKAAEEKERQKARDLQFLSRTALEFAAFPPEGNIYEHIAERLKGLVGDSIVLISSYEATSDDVEIRSVIGLGKLTKRVLKLLGKDLVGMRFAIQKDLEPLLKRGELIKLSGQMYELGQGQLSQKALKAAAKLLGIGDVYSLGMARQGELFASATILAPAGAEFENTPTFAAFANQASVALQRRRAQKALRESEKRYRDLVETITDLVQSVAPDGSLIYANRAWRETLGYEEEEIPGLSLFDVIHPDSMEHCREMFQRVIAGQEVEHVEAKFVTKDGKTLLVEGNANCRFVDGKPVATHGIFRDVTERKRAEEGLRASEQRFRSIIENMPMGMHTYELAADGTLRFAGANPAADAVLGVDNSQYVGKTIDEAFPEIANSEIPERFRAIAEKGGFWHKEDIDYKDERIAGAFENYNFQISPGKMASLFVDITERKRAEEELRRRTRDLNERVKELNCLHEATELMTELDKPLDEVLQSVVRLIPPAWQYPDVTCARISLEGRQFKTDNLKETPSKLAADIRVAGEKAGGVEVYYLEERPEAHEGPFLKEERALIDALAREIGGFVERRRAEEALRMSEARLRSVIESRMIGILFWDAAGNITDANDAFLGMVGYTRDEILSGAARWRDMTPPEYKHLDDRGLEEIAAGGVMTPIQKEYVRKDGSRVPIVLGAASLPGPELNGVAFVLDITDRKRTQDALRESEEKWRSLVENAPNTIMTADREGTIQFINRTVPGMSEEEAIGKKIYDFIPAEYHDVARRALEQVFQAGMVGGYETAGPGPHGATAWYKTQVGPSMRGDKVVAATFIATDITERRYAEQALRESENKYRTLLENLPQKIFLKDKDSAYVSCNENLARDLNIGPDEIVGKTDGELYPAALAGKYRTDDRRIVQSGRTEELEERYVKDGQETWVHTVKTPLKDEQGNVTGILGIFWDITERKTAEDALRASEEKYRNVVERANDGIVVIQDGVVRYMNARLTEMAGYAAEEVVGAQFFDFLDERERPKVLDYYRKRMAGQDVPPVYETVLRRRNGDKMFVEINAGVTAYDNRPADLVFIRDMTEHKQLEAQLLQAQKMEAVGRLAGGIAHDFNNLMTVITGYSELALKSLDEGEPLRKDIEAMKRAGERAAGLTRQLLAFSRRQIIQPRALDVNVVVAGMGKMLQRLIGEDIDLATVLEAGPGRIEADPGQLEQVVMNLAVNARDAMPEGGKLTIETRNAQLDAEYARGKPDVEPGPYVLLAMSDTGCGMDEETRSRIFEPFFTTKAEGKGTGLGLSTAYGIVKQHNGHVTVYSEPGRGTTFKVYLPRHEETVEEEKVGDAPTRAFPGTETVLLVEDEDVVRRVASKMLQVNGYKVLEAHDGDEALLLCGRHERAIHLMMTDVVMPGMSGRELAERVTELYPGIKVLYMSGYTDDAITHHGVLEPGTPFIGKPFAPDDLARKVREVLDTKSGE